MREQLINRWYIATCGLLLLVAATYNIVEGVILRDGTFISIGILVLFGISHLAIPRAIKCNGTEEKLWFIAEVMVALGMIGTVTGFIMMFGEAFARLDTSDPETISAVLTEMASGLGVALVTTLTGLIASFTLKAELVFIAGGDHDL